MSGEWIDDKMTLTNGRETTWTRQTCENSEAYGHFFLGGIVVLLVHFINHPSMGE